jgi:hypothetical protein
MADINKARNLIALQQALFEAAVSELGKTHNKTLRIENETLKTQHYAHLYPEDYITRIEASMSELELLYTSEQEQATFGPWHRWHQSAYLRLLERMCDYYKYTNNVQGVIDAASRIAAIQGYQTERWIAFFLELEYWLQEVKSMELSEFYKKQRLTSEYYRNLKMESVEEENF